MLLWVLLHVPFIVNIFLNKKKYKMSVYNENGSFEFQNDCFSCSALFEILHSESDVIAAFVECQMNLI